MTNFGMEEMHACMERAGVVDPDCPSPDIPWPRMTFLASVPMSSVRGAST